MQTLFSPEMSDKEKGIGVSAFCGKSEAGQDFFAQGKYRFLYLSKGTFSYAKNKKIFDLSTKGILIIKADEEIEIISESEDAFYYGIAFFGEMADEWFIDLKISEEKPIYVADKYARQIESYFHKNIFVENESLQESLYLKVFLQIVDILQRIKNNEIEETVGKYIDNEYILQALDFIDCNLIDPELNRKKIADHVHIHIDYLSELFKKTVGITIYNYIFQERMKYAMLLLKYTNYSNNKISALVGYSDSIYLMKRFKLSQSMSMLSYRKLNRSDKQLGGIMKGIREEYPRPNFVRKDWLNLNGEWEFYIDHGNSGEARKLFECESFDGQILLPFCPESKLSGIENIDFMDSVWYGKNLSFTQKQLSKRVVLHIGACDYQTTVYVNGKEIGRHIGGYTSFSFDLTEWVKVGDNRIVIHAEDDVRTQRQPAGKQSRRYHSQWAMYTRTTGIWQTVWLEFLPKTYIKSVKVNATNLSGKVLLETKLNEFIQNAQMQVEVSFEGQKLLTETFPIDGILNTYAIDVKPVHLWGAGTPNLYDIRYELQINGKKTDEVTGYFGIRRIDIDGEKILINGKPVFQRLILDQGFYPDGICTAPTDKDLKKDIEYAMNLGFNGARLHQKVFEERYLYYADKMGYLVWGEYGDWGLDMMSPYTLHAMIPQWIEAVERDYNHPSIICWCPYNETGVVGECPIRGTLPTNISAVYHATKALDNTRPVVDTSGWSHTENTDIFDVHDYEQNTEIFAERYKKHGEGEFFANFRLVPETPVVRPYMVSEFGGMRWSKEAEGEETSWGYGDEPKDLEEVCRRYESWTETLLSVPNMAGFCYTQLTDVEQEQNGLYYYDRSKKFPDTVYERIRKANKRVAKIEE